jgi:radical SAM superfamily enzyme YgiQ (UPF0313 family)
MKRVLFAFYPTFVDWNYGIALLSTLCKNQGIETDIILLSNVSVFLEKIEKGNYDHIGFSCVNLQDYKISLPFIVAAVKAGHSVLLGGVYASRMKTKLPGIKVCTGDGELLPLFINRGIDSAINLYICKDIGDLPLPDYDLFDGIPYNRELHWLPSDTKWLPYSSSRGCPFKCNFCTICYQQPQHQRIRYKVEEDLNILISKYSPDVLAFGDSLPPYYDERWRESWGNMSHPFVCYIRADIKESELIWLYDHGLAGCFFGVESGNEIYRNQVLGKNLYDKDIFRTVSLLKEMCTNFIASYIQGAPGETWEIKGETTKMAEAIGCHPVFYNYEDRSIM